MPTRLQKAEKMSKRSIDIEPENSSSLDTYAWIMFLKRDYKTALEYIEKAMENADSERNNAELLEHYGDILFMLGRPDEALEQWKKALEENPDSELLKKKSTTKRISMNDMRILIVVPLLAVLLLPAGHQSKLRLFRRKTASSLKSKSRQIGTLRPIIPPPSPNPFRNGPT